jgi:hypothetical protein
VETGTFYVQLLFFLKPEKERGSSVEKNPSPP